MSEKIIKAICNPVRLKIIGCLSQNQKTVSELITNCELSQSAVSQHLIKLKEANLVKDTKVGREIYYSLKSKKLTVISNLILDLEREIQ